MPPPTATPAPKISPAPCGQKSILIQPYHTICVGALFQRGHAHLFAPAPEADAPIPIYYKHTRGGNVPFYFKFVETPASYEEMVQLLNAGELTYEAPPGINEAPAYYKGPNYPAQAPAVPFAYEAPATNAAPEGEGLELQTPEIVWNFV